MSELNREVMQSALFVQLVMQQANMAMMLLGKVPNPETGQPMREVEAAQVFIDQIEMIEAKTKGNLNSQEAALLKQTLMSLRMAFVETVNEPATKSEESKPVADKPAEEAKEKSPPAEAGADDSSKKFSKKYSL